MYRLIRKKAALIRSGGLFIPFSFLLLSVVLFLFIRFRFQYVMSRSMEPALPLGTLVVVDPYRSAGVGDVAVYRIGQGLVAHRVVGKSGDAYIFRGDANEAEDPYIVYGDAVVGPVIFQFNRTSSFMKVLHDL